MAPESERAKRYEEIGNYLDGVAGKFTLQHADTSKLWQHCSWLLDRIRELDTPTEPTLTYSEVVERLPRARQFAHAAMQKVMHNPDTWKEGIPLPYFTEQMAVEMLVEFADGEERHSWRERRVQELEEALREMVTTFESSDHADTVSQYGRCRRGADSCVICKAEFVLGGK